MQDPSSFAVLRHAIPSSERLYAALILQPQWPTCGRMPNRTCLEYLETCACTDRGQNRAIRTSYSGSISSLLRGELQAMTKKVTDRNQAVLRGFAFMQAYQAARGAPQEAAYNMARAAHGLNLLHVAVPLYEQALQWVFFTQALCPGCSTCYVHTQGSSRRA